MLVFVATDLIFERFDVVPDDCRICESVDVVAEVGPRRGVLQLGQDLRGNKSH